MVRSCTFLLVVGLLTPQFAAGQTPKPAAPRATTQKKKPSAAAPTTKAPDPVKEPEPPKRIPPDLQLTTTHATGDTRTTSTVLLKGARARISVGDNLASIQQCDAGQSVQLNTQIRTYLATPFEKNDAVPAPDPKRKGGQVIYTTTITDTGEKQTMFGFTARRIKTVVSKDSTTNACDKKPQKVETDGWYIELPTTVSCATVPTARVTLQADPQHPDCVDEIKYQGGESSPGYPIKYTATATTGDETPITTTMEVTQLERTDVDAATMDVPADYLQVHTVAQLTADHRPGEPGTKKPGAVRVGLTPISNKSAAKLETDTLNEALLESFSETDLDIVRLNGSTPAELEADAKRKDVDLLLTNTISEVKVPRGGIMSKVNGTSGEAFSARVDYALVAPGQPKPTRAGSERSGGSTLTSAINLARKVVQFAPPLMMAKYGYMNAYGSMLTQGGPSGAMRQTPDPVMNMAFSLLDHAVKPTAAEQYSTEEGAVASALEKIVSGVSSDLTKKRK